MSGTSSFETTINCKNNPTGVIRTTQVPGFPQLVVLREGICQECTIKPLIRQGSRTVSIAKGEMVECVPVLMIEDLKAQLAILRVIGASAEEIELVEGKIQAEGR